jgi:hypothetical protein
MHSWSTFGANTSHGQTQTHKTHHGLDLKEATTFPLILYFVPLHKPHIQMAFRLRTLIVSLEIAKVGILMTLGPITLCEDLWLRWGPKQSYSFHRKLSNGMSHITCTWGNWVNSQFLMVGSQIANLTFNLLLAITCVSDVQMGHVSPFQTFTVQYFFNEITNFLIHWILTRTITLWKFVRVKTQFVATLLWQSVRMRLTLPKWGLGSPLRLLKL